jgi:hypothetical protein
MDVLTTLPLPLAEWLSVVEREYLTEFVPAGGAAVKFAIMDDDVVGTAMEHLVRLGQAHAMLTVPVTADRTRIHMMQELFYSIARALLWDSLVQRYLEGLFGAHDYAWPRPGEPMTLPDLATAFAVAPNLLAILLDEIELIGRYTPLQRALSYAGLGALLGLDAERRCTGIVTAYAITDDFVTAVINARLDSERLPERLTLKGRAKEAALALSAIRHIERTVLQNRLMPPTLNDLATCHDKVRQLYTTAYGWPAPPLPPPERTSSRTMRQYIKGWVTQWDVRRLGGGEVLLVAGGIASNYTEDATLAETHPLNDEET